ncbi:hypothetical protein EAX62_02110 [Tessaracoccus antarcticus]|uniref:Uncharacterized protein n=2 Tax=Tessaracoccus antarcticus TaxID=2479848 RepID=A0A3M0GIM0_9ACTN|nr:hypothetical protein EAX62_02110 [Tessaracoccus antarcticus]
MHSMPRKQSNHRPSGGGFGPAVGEPPPWVDPRRWGSLIGLAGGMWFIAGYSPSLGPVVSVAALIAGLGLVGAALFFHYVRPVALGPLARPGLMALLTYGACVVGELVLISLGSQGLTATGHADLRPALIAAVVGLHFIPFAWAFGERMFYLLGSLVAALGTVGLLVGVMGVPRAADAMAVTAGLVMQVVILLYARGRFAPRPTLRPTA